MFGKDEFIISKPREIKPVARTFMQNIKNVVSNEPSQKVVNFVSEPKKVIEQPVLKKPELPKLQKLNTNNLNKDNVNNIKPEPIKTMATTFLNQVNKVAEKTNPKPPDKLIFSYSDRKGKVGILDTKGEKLKVIVKKNKLKDYDEDIIEVYLKGVEVKQDGIFIQTKGYGNTKELAIANALKNAVLKLNVIKSDMLEKIILNYSLSTISSLIDGGFECKLKVTPGKL